MQYEFIPLQTVRYIVLKPGSGRVDYAVIILLYDARPLLPKVVKTEPVGELNVV